MNRGAEVEKDIKILENYIYGKKETMKEQLVVAIENLIKGYREKERKLKIKNGDIEWMQNKINKHFIDDVTLQQDYIPKSKIQREMEKLDNMMKETINGKLQKYTPGEIIFLKRFLQELMGEK